MEAGQHTLKVTEEQNDACEMEAGQLTLEATVEQHNPCEEDSGFFQDHQDGKDVLTAKQRTAKEERQKLASRESRVIWYLRVVILVLFSFVALVSCASIYVIFSDRAVNAFETEFSYHASTVLENYVVQVSRQLDALDGLSVDYTSHALESNHTFPYVILPDLEYRGSNTRVSSNIISAIYTPAVTEEQRPDWELFALANAETVMKTYDNEENLKNAQDEQFGLDHVVLDLANMFGMTNETDVVDVSELITPEGYSIWYPGLHLAKDEPKDIYFPVWQYSPSIPSSSIYFMNLDLAHYAFANESFHVTQHSGKACIGYVTDFIDNDEYLDDAAVFEIFIQSSQYRHTGEHYEGDPMSALSYPVFDKFGDDRQVVGVLSSSLYWRFLFTNILPANVQSMHCVLENSAGQVFTYILEGDVAHFVGAGDLHNPSYDDLGQSIDLLEYTTNNSSPLTQSFTAADLSLNFLNYTLSVYPTDSFHDHYVTGEAIDEAIGAGFLFLFSCVAFCFYDCCIQRRQRIVLDRAVKATAVVGSLYPEALREQIINDTPAENRRKNVFLRKEVETTSVTPWASKYPNCTVYFADLAGFTHWASTREPEQVFELLEALYGAFDAIALRRGVFKVETVGDCYMAVTGIPKEQPDHAVRMAKFALECQQRMLEITTSELAVRLGEGTDSLALRTGLHSGDVTAGVLRGEKGRFQLFGDTVNTASRMESTGVPRRVQVSQSTADALILAGKESWLSSREDLVYAKGKGNLQTYFLEAPHEEASDSWGDQEANVVDAKRRTAEQERNKLARRESKVIRYLRIVIFVLFAVVALICSISVFIFAREESISDFETEFNYLAATVLDKYVSQMVRQLHALDKLSIDYTSYALESNQTFPFVTLPHSEYRGSNTRVSASMISAVYMPVITEEMRPEWEYFALTHLDEAMQPYVNEEALKRAQDEKYGLDPVELDLISVYGDNNESATDLSELVSEEGFHIWYPGVYTANDEPKDMYFPIWQYSPNLPPSASLINLDLAYYGFVSEALHITQRTGLATIDYISDFITNDNSLKDAAVFEFLIRSGQYRHTDEHYEGDPLSTLAYPVFDQFGEDKNVVGLLYTSLYWRFLFTDLLASNVQPLCCVLENTNGQAFTYSLEGDMAHLEGVGDLHNPMYDYIGKSVHLADYVLEQSSPLTKSFTEVDLDVAYLNYTLSVYPSDTFHDHYVTNQALQQALAVGMLFLFSFCVFSVYDCCIQRRQRIVMDRAVKATAVLGSLYPENVREQIINDTEVDDRKQRGNVFLRKTSSAAPPPLASKYSDCTVYFADLAGFTRWASTREPEQVFQLLETLYGAFDAIALKRGVYKVETIGDCYMAVTGIPNEQPDHAVRMARFATECKEKMEEITTELTGTLGDGTDDLALRTGMHSGEVTAGVLRGEKGRFQLFGDTVNTASRMESTGTPRKIQVSQSTADELIFAGKEAWLTPREDQVYAKGKGHLQTYFLNVRASSDKSDETRTITSVGTAKLEQGDTDHSSSLHAN
eukprot:Nitzschia sp. Nitz4//scaffold84_size84139//67428//72955//NITZ4_005210-RA/size84139-processed-gene-0.21-mRNA-1//-1//CDS//3329559069//3649//frame0